jgi:hypothetical protein
MNWFWQRLRPHILSWHMLPCALMLIAAVAVTVATGRPGSVLGAVGCIVMMMAMMSAMGGHQHGARSDEDHKN